MYKMLQQVCGEGIMTRTVVFVQIKQFREEREDVSYNEISGRPTISRSNPNVEKGLEGNDRRLAVLKLTEQVKVNRARKKLID